MSDSYPVLFGKALAQALHNANLGLYKTSATYTNTETATRPGITLADAFPTGFDNCIVLNELEPITDGRANIVWRYQLLCRTTGGRTAARNLAWNLRVFFDHKQNIPPGFNVSWVWVVSQLAFTADASNRHSTAMTVYFRGRRPLA